MDKIIRVLMAGAVRHAFDYAPIIASHPRMKLVGIAEESNADLWKIDLARELANKYDISYFSIEDALSRKDIDLVVITTEPTRHTSLAIQAIKAKKNIIVDKPVATSIADAEELAKVIQMSNLVTSYFHRLFEPTVERAKGLIQSGQLGLPLTLDLMWISSNSLANEGGDIIIEKQLSGGGEIRNFLGYPLDIVLWLTDLKPVRIYATSNSITSNDHTASGVENLATIVLELESGVRANITVGRGPNVGNGIFTTSIVGSHGFLSVNENRPTLEIATTVKDFKSSINLEQENFEKLFNHLLNDFVSALDGKTHVRRTLLDGCKIAGLIDTACTSASTSQPVTVNFQ
jgi:predicted dehydrogenase